MHHAVIWLLVVELLGLLALPITYSLFRRLPDRGLILSIPLALLLVSYILWILGLAHILPNSQYSIIGILAVIALVSSLMLRRSLPQIRSFFRQNWLPFVLAQLVFIGLYFLWISLVSNSPAINHTEKPMDFAFLNSILRSTYFPPEDPWLAGHSISYYYFGHLMMALLTKLTSIPSSISYNLSIALIPAMVGAAAFSVVYNLIRLSGAQMRMAMLFTLAAPVFIVLIGNLEGVLEFVHARGWGSDGFWQSVSIKGLEGGQAGNASIFPQAHFWWWHATRVIDTLAAGVSLDYTITEFPFFSFMLGDLHAHVSALPFILLSVSMALNLFSSEEKLGFGWLRKHPWQALIIALALGSLAFINIWDFPVFVTFLVAVVLVKGYADWRGQVTPGLIAAVGFLAPVIAAAVLLFLPFYLDLESQVSGILPLRDVSTRPLFFFLIWGLFILLSGSFLLRQLPSVPGLTKGQPGVLSLVLVITVLPFLLWTGIELLLGPSDNGLINTLGTIGTRLGKLIPAMAIVAIALYSMFLRVAHGGERATAFVLFPLALAFYLLMGAELFYLSDLFGNRMNTVFKFYYQAWLLLAVVSAYGLYYCVSRPVPSLPDFAKGTGVGAKLSTSLFPRLSRNVLRYGWLGLVAVLILASLYYPVGAALDRADELDGDTLDGLAFLQRRDFDEYQAIKWLRDEAPRGRLVEAVGDDYSAYGRISSSTGLPTMLGWKFHEHQWRGSTRVFQGREEQVRQIYSSNDPEQVSRLLDAYDIRYVYVGFRERAKYGQVQFDEFSEFLEAVFQSADVVVYQRLSAGSEETP